MLSMGYIMWAHPHFVTAARWRRSRMSPPLHSRGFDMCFKQTLLLRLGFSSWWIKHFPHFNDMKSILTYINQLSMYVFWIIFNKCYKGWADTNDFKQIWTDNYGSTVVIWSNLKSSLVSLLLSCFSVSKFRILSSFTQRKKKPANVSFQSRWWSQPCTQTCYSTWKSGDLKKRRGSKT